MSTKDQETTLNVAGMTCRSCILHVNEALRRLEGVDGVAVQLADGTVRVRHDPAQASVAQLIDALAGAGYEARA